MLCVVASHIAHELVNLLAGRIRGFDSKIFPGDFGVDLFFVISGFIMVYTCWEAFARPGSSLDFLKRRIIRIVPLYWVVTTLMILVVVLLPGKVSNATSDWQQWLSSYLFYPFAREGDGMVRPVLGLGRSLQYEMFFYGLFTLALFLPRKNGLVFLCAMLAAIWASANLLVPAHWQNIGLFSFLAHPIMLEFAAGVLIGYVYCKGFRFNILSGWFVASLGVITLLIVLPFNEVIDQWRLIHYGVPATLMVSAVVFTRGLDEVRIVRPAYETDEFSYAIYLTHPFVIGGLSVAFRKAGLLESLPALNLLLIFSATVLIVSLLIGYMVHYRFDLPFTNALRRHWQRGLLRSTLTSPISRSGTVYRP